MQSIIRKNDVVTGRQDLEPLLTITSFPVFMGCSSESSSMDILADMKWAISKFSGCIQLESLIPLEILYEKPHGSGSVGKLWHEHHCAFASFLRKFSPKIVLEVGGGHGILSREYQKLGTADWTIVEPNPSPSAAVSARYIDSFIDESFVPDRNYDTVVHSHVLEHMYEPQMFLQLLAKVMPSDTLHICSFPNMRRMLEKGFANTLNFEHSYFLTEEYAECMFAYAGYELLEKAYFKDDHSIFYAWKKTGISRNTPLDDGLYERNKELFLSYVNDLNETVKRINASIFSLKDAQIFLFGAHIFSQQLIALGLQQSRITAIIDNDTKKWGKRLSGTDLNVESPKILEQYESPAVIVKMGAYTQEIKNDISQNINRNAFFLDEDV